ncbi:MAG: hypothetical protein HY301_17735 [Verrucomicrobia bacterium]|nr:hypothetical protein [Verrucomicrobiota bacterium]
MNSASENLEHHLGILRERLLHPTDYEKAFHYFLEGFGGDQKFIALGEVEEAPNLVAVLAHIASQGFGRPVRLERTRLSAMPKFRFHHGSAAVDGRALVCFYFEEVNTGLMIVLPGVKGEADIARFRLPPGMGVTTGNN